ncbi:MAG: cytochrome c-type biogenesis protein, partial [Gemmatimonadales bacterium]
AWLRPPPPPPPPPLPAPPQDQDTLAGGPAGRLWDPSRAGRPVQPTTARETDAEIQAIEKRLRCTCGCNLDVYTCRTTDFTCEVSPAMHREVVALHEAGRTADEIVDDFVRRHGVAILMAPPKRGFNLAAYFVPSLAILAAGAVLLIVLRRWTRAGAPAVAAARGPADPTATASPQELDRLRQELERFPD